MPSAHPHFKRKEQRPNRGNRVMALADPQADPLERLDTGEALRTLLDRIPSKSGWRRPSESTRSALPIVRNQQVLESERRLHTHIGTIVSTSPPAS